MAMFKVVNIDSIRVGGGRIRRDVGDLASLTRSITLLGWVSPIVVDEDLNLVAGYRRLEALRKAGVKHVAVQVVPRGLAEVIQAVENTHRKELRWDEVVEAVARAHASLEKMAGRLFVTNNRRKPWTQSDTAQLFGLSQEHVSKCLRMYRSRFWPRLRELRTFDEAYERLLLLEDVEEAEDGEGRRGSVGRPAGGDVDRLAETMRKLTVMEMIGQVQRLEAEVGGLCPIHGDARLSLWDVRLSCGHTLREVLEMLHEEERRMEVAVRNG